ncbi:MAG: MBL fold metallo-hydrolase [Sulfolobales archaeon]|nr:MBL fold metallo-hydrolase [Sulfolobales archaeon]
MEVVPVAFDSLGVRSMATVVSTRSVRIFIDPSAALAPVRYGLPPHELELRQLESSVSRIESLLADVDVIIVTHYHYDHHDPGYRIPAERYSSKTLLIKDPVENINISQRIRASKFLKMVRSAGARVQVADGRTFELGTTRIVFSNPVPHGSSARLGYVVMARIEDGGDALSFSSDVEGPLEDYVVEFACGSRVSIIDGPPTYLVGRAYTPREVRIARENLAKLSKCVETLIVDHHLMRDLNYVKLFREISELSSRKPISAAEFLGLEPNLLEARRGELYRTSREE